MREEIQNASTLVLKIGSSLLLRQTDGGSQGLNVDWLAAMASDIAQARTKGQKIILVTSGALALGCAKFGVQRQDLNLAQSQAASATGQIELVRGWQSALDAQALQSAQVLLTAEDTEQRRRYLNARQTLTALLDMGVIPVINENDTLATQELRYGDNDRLAARVAAMSRPIVWCCSAISMGSIRPIRKKPKAANFWMWWKKSPPKLAPWPAAVARNTARAAWSPNCKRARLPKARAAIWFWLAGALCRR